MTMIKYFKLFCLKPFCLIILTAFVCLVFSASYVDAAKRLESIVAVVNKDAVSASDLNARLKLVMVSSGMPDNAEIRDRMIPQILNILIDEQLKLQEAERYEIEIAQEEVDQGLATLAQQNNLTADQFRTLLAKQKIAARTLEDQIRAQIAWSKVVQARLRPQIKVSDNEVDAILQRLQDNIGRTEYRVFEIFLPVNDPKEEGDARKLAERLHGQIKSGKAPFQRVASQFSQSPGATRGGDIGWIQEGQLADALDQNLVKMEKGALSTPIRSLSGYHLLYVAETRAIDEETMPSRFKIENQLGLEKLDRLQRRYLLDLKTEAFIERRA